MEPCRMSQSRPTLVPVRSTPVLDGAGAVAAARELAPRIAARARACEAARRVPDETIAELHASGLMRLMQPRRFGGSELGIETMLDVVVELAPACPSTAWVYMNLAGHSWNVAQFELRAQEDMWNDDPSALAATGLAFPCGKAQPVEGGYLVSGRWPFGSGVDASTWMLVGAVVEREHGTGIPERRFLLVPAADFRSLGNWDAYGLAGTGSHDVEVKGAFVPEHRTLNAEVFAAGTAVPGAAVHAHWMYRLPTFATFGFSLAMVPIAAARGAVAEFTAATRKRAGTYTGARVAELTPVQIRIGEASAAVDFALGQLRRDLREMCAIVEAGGVADMDAKLRWKRNCAFGVQLATRAVDTLMSASGAGGLSTNAPMQRLFRDIHAGASHIALTWDVQSAAYGQHALGVPMQAGLLL
jgi:3-hydroxy-9,10-secoandrosta-1,3,5(10)-triene-9,17-dione monooxygenase